MTKAPPADRSERYQALLSAAADKHHTKVTDTRAVYEAGIVMVHEDMTAAMVAGEKIDIAAYLKLSEELQKLVPPPEPLKVTIDIVDSVTGIFNCVHCGKRNDIEDYQAPPAPKPAPRIDGQATESPATKSLPAPTAKPAPTRQGVSPSAFHDQVLPGPGGGEIPPLKRLQGAGAGAAGSLCWTASKWPLEAGRSKWADDQNPNFDSAGRPRNGHALPTTKG
jgi:hypothetical protein